MRKKRLLHVRELEASLRDQPQLEMLQTLDAYQSSGLVRLVDSSIDRVADAAVQILVTRCEETLLAEGVATKAISTRLGRIRALKTLHARGRHCPAAREAYLAGIRDSSSDVVGYALFGLAFLQDDSVLPALKEAMGKLRSFDRLTATRFELAIRALEQENPRLYDSKFCDEHNVWGLGGQS